MTVGEWRRLVVGYLTTVLVMVVAVAYASPPDPVWISGIYDDRDADDVVVMLTNGTGINDAQEQQRVEDGLLGAVALAMMKWMPTSTGDQQTVRGPPIGVRGARDGSQAMSPSRPRLYLWLEPLPPHPADTNPDRGEASCR